MVKDEDRALFGKEYRKVEGYDHLALAEQVVIEEVYIVPNTGAKIVKVLKASGGVAEFGFRMFFELYREVPSGAVN